MTNILQDIELELETKNDIEPIIINKEIQESGGGMKIQDTRKYCDDKLKKGECLLDFSNLFS